MERLGIVGLPNSGKSSLFRALTGMDVEIAAYPFTTTGSNVGVAQVPDERLERLAELSGSDKVVPAGLNVTDIAGLVAGASTGEGLGNAFLGQIREADAICYVLRAFDDPGVPYSVEPPDPAADLETLELELCLADLTTVEARLAKARKAAQADPKQKPLVAAMEAAQAAVGDGVPLYRAGLADDGRAALRELFLLTNKPVVFVVNIGEADLGSEREIEAGLAEVVGADAEVAAVCVALEAEAADLDDAAARAELLASFGVAEPALPRAARAAYHALGKRTFLTTGPKESRAWTIRAGDSARRAAGVIHSDLERGFIRAEVVSYDAVVAAGGWDQAKAAGAMRLEGKDYVVADGDVLEIRFNV